MIGGRNAHPRQVAVRVSSQSYITSLLLGTFFSGLFFYLELDIAGVLLFGVSWILIPILAFNDQISFDGKRILRTGLLPKLWSNLNSTRRSLKVSDIEQVETHANRSVRRGANILYRYQIIVRGKGLSISIASGGDAFRELARRILVLLPDNVLDSRSIELRDHLSDPKEILMKAEFSRIPAADVLESSLRHSDLRGKRRHSSTEQPPEEEKAEDLRTLGNELRLSGYLLPAIEAFRRALVLKPSDGRLLFDFARCLYSVAGIERDPRLERRALAALRLSERRADGDGELLVRLGEWYFQIGEWRRAGSVFKTAMDRLGENFRTARGLAEIALQEGKIAHVIHHFSTANRLADTPSLRRWSKNEAEYFSNLNSDDEYMDLEIGRVNMLETVERSKRTVLRIALYAFPLIAAGIFFEDSLVANIGWAVATVALLIWTGLIITLRMLSQRIPYDLMPSDK